MKYDVETGGVSMGAEALCVLALRQSRVADFVSRREADSAVALRYASETEIAFSEHTAFCGRLFCGDICVTLGASADLWRISPEELLLVFGRNGQSMREEFEAYIKCCAYLALEAGQAERVRVRTVSSERDGSLRLSESVYQKDGLLAFVRQLLTRISGRLALTVGHETRIRPSADKVPFPYDQVREGQDRLIHDSYSAIRRGQRLFVSAPTGIGKTMSTLYPAVRAFGRGLCDKIFYLTAKSATAREAYNAAARLYAAGAQLRTVVLSAKDQMCCAGVGCAGKQCTPRECSFLRGYYDRVEAAIEELLAEHNGYYADLIKQVAAKYGLCPYELSLDLSEVCDIIICDYNYLFDPMVYLRRYFERTGDFGEYVFLVDEAHNLADRARDMYSVTFGRGRVAQFSQLVAEEIELRAAIAPLSSAFDRLPTLCRETAHTDAVGHEVGYYISRNPIDGFCSVIPPLEEKLTAWLRANRRHELYDAVRDFTAAVRKCACIINYYDDKFMTYVELSGEELSISLQCIDPSDIVDGCMKKGRASVLFSATLTPISYFCDILGGGKRAHCLELPSPYEPRNLCLAAVDTVSTRFEDRDGNYKKIATLIAAAISPKAGNYIAYFPSYGYLQKVYEAFTAKYPKVRTAVQSRGMTAAEREAFLAFFREDEDRMRVGFCVLGGSFSEGVDLPGTRLIGTVIVGVGLPGFSSERNIMKDYFENRYENGFDYAYTFPGMNNVLQAAGRVIRRESDRGIVVLIDDRYGSPTYKNLFPPHWKHLKYAGNSASLAEIARKFWEKP